MQGDEGSGIETKRARLGAAGGGLDRPGPVDGGLAVISNERPPDERAFLVGERDAGEADISDRISDSDEPRVERQRVHRSVGQVDDRAFAGNQRTGEADGLGGIGEAVERLPFFKNRLEFLDRRSRIKPRAVGGGFDDGELDGRCRALESRKLGDETLRWRRP